MTHGPDLTSKSSHESTDLTTLTRVQKKCLDILF